jgi:hypothetical protein
MSGGKGITASVAAMVSAIATIGCCVPLGFLAALGAAGASAFLASARPWLLGLSVLLLGAGFVQQYRGARCGVKRSVLSVVLLWTATAVVLAMLLFPQAVAGFLADRLSWGGR